MNDPICIAALLITCSCFLTIVANVMHLVLMPRICFIVYNVRIASFQDDQLGLSLLTLEQLESEEFQQRIQTAAQA